MEMIKFPEELIEVTEIDDNGDRVLKKGATEEQRKIFERFKKDIDNGTLTDMEIEY